MVMDPEITAKIIEMTQQQMYAVTQNVYRETLRELLHIFGSIYTIDGNGNRIRVSCSNGRQERAVGKQAQENTLILPYITITEIGTNNADSRRRVQQVLVNESLWDDKELRAKRYLSLSPRPVDIAYQINIWTKYQADMDIIRYAIFSMFNPDLTIKTRYSDFTKAFIESESDIGVYEAQDTSDRKLQKSIDIKVETYLPSPKFLYTNTGEIENTIFEVDIQSGGCDS